jgi:DNA-binding NtrC family response regulator
MSGQTRGILIVEDDDGMRALIREELEGVGHQVATASGEREARQRLERTAFEAIICDLRLPDGDGIHLLEHVRSLPDGHAIGFIVITGFGSIEQAVEALKKRADDFITKPLDLDHLCLSVSRVLEHLQLRRRLNGYETLYGRDSFHGMVGQSGPMQRLYRGIEQMARSDAPVLIRGESGTGKELVARAVHACSHRHQGPFIAVNCAGVPAELMENEFFGHVRGAFTGAATKRMGLVAAASGGTLFLDEIGEMALSMQAKLLRVLEDGALRPVGADKEVRADVRIVAATNRDLEAQVESGEFREDLFYRIDALGLQVPALRARGDDIEQLAVRLLASAAERLGQSTPTLTQAATDAIRQYQWPGNVRELANAMERALTHADGSRIDTGDLPARLTRVSDPGPFGMGDQGATTEGTLATLAEVESAHIKRVLDAVGGNRRRAAEILGIGRRTLYRRLS